MNASTPQKTLNDFATRLEKLASDLDAGQSFSVTRLTPLKRLCADHAFAVRFASHFADIAYRKFLARKFPDYTTASQWKNIGAAVECGIKSLRHFNSEPSSAGSSNSLLSSAHALLVNAQNDYRKGHWGQIRIAYSMEALTIEKAIECVLRPAESPSICYQIARDHAERYEPKFGTGLIPSSADAVRDISRFLRAEAERAA
ncbi:hypothetical protein [uncultured Azohydromonas sp.]|jgi:hypothetical protein|uniref:hypothetical protein n=1 Tax=uncultured Azohydromonas sp. TaxID=487342 RepID=UPI00260741A8|nr:hypothetical protein [uncultured Azohydromonas sp.]